MLSIVTSIKIIMQEKILEEKSYLTSVKGNIAKNLEWHIKPDLWATFYLGKEKYVKIIIFIPIQLQKNLIILLAIPEIPL